MRYSIGDIVRFKVGTDEIQEGKVQAIEKSHDEEILDLLRYNPYISMLR